MDLHGKLGYEGKEPNEKKEEVIVTEPKAYALGDLDFVVKAFELASGDRERGVSNQTIEALFFNRGKAN